MSHDRFIGVEGLPYYRVNVRNSRAYWCPTARMKRFGFHTQSLGTDGLEARAAAVQWTERWKAAREDEVDHQVLGPMPAERLRARDNADYVYFLQVADRIKIGSSRHLVKRVRELAGAAHKRATRLIVVRGNAADERRLHQRFAAYRTHGEWFVAARPLLLSIGRCAMAGQVVHDGEQKTSAKLNRGEAVESQPRAEALNA